MNYPLISEYIEAIKSAEDNFEELSYLRPVLGDDGLPVMTSGNFAVVFKMKDEQSGKFYAVKCFTKEQEGRAEAYCEIAKELEKDSSPYILSIRYLDKELFVDTEQTGETEFPVLLMDWVEGKTLDKYLRENLDDKYALEMLTYRFSQLAQWLIPQPFAHGDLKPDNILVREDGTLVLVDYDGMYVPAMKGQKARELGSPDFRHPLRTENDFNELIDDFPIATILFSLYHISNNSTLLEMYGSNDRLLLSKNDYLDIEHSEVIRHIYTDNSDLYFIILTFALDDQYFKNVELSWLRLLNKHVEPVSPIIIPKVMVSYGGSIINMIYVEGGSFYMGAQRESPRMPNYDFEAKTDEGPVKKCHVDGFWISESLVTMDIWPWFADNPDGVYPYNIRERCEDDNLYAVSRVTYNDCLGFMRGLSKATNIKFDFPTEAEWEYAARGGLHSHGYIYSGSDIIKDVALYGNFLDIFGIPLCPVKTKKPNELGLFDMSGGLYEWCKDPSSDYIHNIDSNFHYVRGGCINSKSDRCRVAYRGKYYEKDYTEWEPFLWQVGLRLVARDINIEQMTGKDGNYVKSYFGYATDDDIKNALTDKYGVKYSKEGTKLISTPKDLISYKVKDGVEVICHDAFNNSQIEEVLLPDSLMVIGDQAFYGAKKLKEIVIPNKVFIMGTQAFCGCESLNRIDIPTSVNYIESLCFFGCDSLHNITLPDNIDVLEYSIFSFCSSLECVILPKNLKKICRSAFWNCKKMRSITIPANVKEIEDNPFQGSGIIELECNTPVFVFENGFLMTADKTELVACLTKKKYISVHQSIRIIREHAFYGCHSIEQVFLPDGLTEIKEYAFSGCPALSELVIPSSVRTIHRGFLSECSSVKRLVIHSKDIWFQDNSSFYETGSLSQIIVPSEIKESFNKQFVELSSIVEDY